LSVCFFAASAFSVEGGGEQPYGAIGGCEHRMSIARNEPPIATPHHVHPCPPPTYLQLVELKNGETYNGNLVSVDIFMNLQLSDVICTSKVSAQSS
jgi:hypothetical protein